MGYVVKEGKSVIYGDEDGVLHRHVAGETVEGAKRGELDDCSAVEWLTAKQAKALEEEPDQEPAGDGDDDTDGADTDGADDGEDDDDSDGAEEQGGS